MRRFFAVPVVAFLSLTMLTGCATRGQLRRAQAEQSAALEAERTQRMAAATAMEQQLTTLRTDLDALRRDLTALQTQFNTTITSLGQQLQFAMPIYFGFNEAGVAQNNQAALDRFAQTIQQHYPGSLVTVEGFADPAGSAAYNERLSRARADSVRAYLVGRGIPENQLRAVGYGETRLISEGAAAAEPGAELNRRVVFVVDRGTAMGAAGGAVSSQ